MPCEKQEELRRTAMDILRRIDALTEVQIQAMREHDDEKLMEADKQLEVAFGEKQRTFGALFDHRNEHGC
jgi:hypothetical protein